MSARAARLWLDLPSPEDLVRKLQDTPPPAPAALTAGSNGGGGGPKAQATPPMPTARMSMAGGAAQPVQAASPQDALARFGSFEDVVALIRTHRDVKLQS